MKPEWVMREITMQDVRMAVGEGKLTAHDVLAGCNAEIKRRHLLAAAPSPVFSEEDTALIAEARATSEALKDIGEGKFAALLFRLADRLSALNLGPSNG